MASQDGKPMNDPDFNWEKAGQPGFMGLASPARL